jgi:hypothetical protein
MVARKSVVRSSIVNEPGAQLFLNEIDIEGFEQKYGEMLK